MVQRSLEMNLLSGGGMEEREFPCVEKQPAALEATPDKLILPSIAVGRVPTTGGKYA